MNDILEKVVKYATLFTALFLILEASKIVFYYWLWDFNIIPYLTISFYFSQFVGDMGKLIDLGLLAIYIIAIILFFRLIFPKKKGWKFYFKFWLTLLFLPLLPAMLFLYIFDSAIIGLSVYIVSFIILVFSFEYVINVPDLSFHTLKETIEAFKNYFEEQVGSADPNTSAIPVANTLTPKRNLYHSLVPIFIISFISVSILTSFVKYKVLITTVYNRKTELILEKDTIPMFAKQFYIGHTPDFYFVYDDSLIHVRVIKASGVKEIRTKE